MIKITETKTCPICMTTFPRPTGKSNIVWSKQQCCGRNYAAIFRRNVINPKRIRRMNITPGLNRYAGWSKKER